MDYMSTDFGAIAQDAFLLERGQTDRQTDATECPISRGREFSRVLSAIITHACGSRNKC